ncbi:histidinol-phosphate transaminase [Actinocrinis puniceicyclus]|uniref:Histidinol-phosphate aminotransferase n=1 Tax=Actinocrinis puniceicyclus TaxID=977794 RepID=A0A8J7WN58_9ACTN|nr:histidinol-phosphate transaminase [Actinocrinis puniceicyclus]MBS2964398.1 histidinol-phosphate transaminase [Actinocrinis puniceicyclus]
MPASAQARFAPPSHDAPNAGAGEPIALASNESPFGPLPSVAQAIARAATRVNRYPDMGSAELAGRLALRYGVAAEQIALGAGSAALCLQLVRAACPRGDGEIAFSWRSFEAYPLFAAIAGAGQRRAPLGADHAPDLGALLAALSPATRLVFVCTPNNPTGVAVRAADLDAFVEAVPPGVLIVLDEAYREFVDDDTAADAVATARRWWSRGRDNVAVLRTFSKAYGLAGLRIGYLIAPPAVADAVRRGAPPYDVSALAQAAALASLDADRELAERCGVITHERRRVREALIEAGFDVPASQANFLWLPLAGRATRFAEHCLRRGVLVKAFAEDDGVRVTMGSARENDAFLAAAADFPRG